MQLRRAHGRMWPGAVQPTPGLAPPLSDQEGTDTSVGEMFPVERRTASEAKALAKGMGEAVGRLYLALSRLEDGDPHTRADDLEWAAELLAAINDQAGAIVDKLWDLEGGRGP
jgi:hypothetical protein